MGKISIALQGWRFDEEAVFDEEGNFKPLSEMDPDTRLRLNRLTTLREEPCDCCWLLYGESDEERCRSAAYVYGEPHAEVLICDVHLDDFSYWYFEAGGQAYRGEEAFQDEFHAWFADGGRAPEGYEGIEHETTDPEAIPEPTATEPAIRDVPVPEDEQVRVSLRPGSADSESDESETVDEETAAEVVDEDLADAISDLRSEP